MFSPTVGTGLILAAPAAGREALKLIDQTSQTFTNMLGAAADTLGFKSAGDAPEAAQASDAAGKSSISIESIKTLGKNLAADFHRRAIGALEAAGIDTSHEFSLRLGSHGEVVVMGDHPDKQLIEQLLNSGELPELFSRLSGLQEIAHAHDERPSFREAFGRDPLAAVASYAQSTNDTPAGVLQLTLSDQGITIDFPAW